MRADTPGMYADLARARFTAFFFVIGLALMAICDVCAVFETPRDPLIGEALHLVGLALLVTTMLEPFTAMLRHPAAAKATVAFCNAYLAYHVVVLLWMAMG